MKNKILNVNTVEIRELLLIVMASGFGVIHAYAWIVSEKEYLKNASDIYKEMEHIVDISAVGWLLLVSSLVLFLSEFMKPKPQKIMVIGSSFICSVIHLLYGMIGVESANIFITYYTNMLVGIIQASIFLTGVIEFWKIKQLQTSD